MLVRLSLVGGIKLDFWYINEITDVWRPKWIANVDFRYEKFWCRSVGKLAKNATYIVTMIYVVT